MTPIWCWSGTATRVSSYGRPPTLGPTGCGDIVGERWSLLLIREPLTGPKRFGDLQNNLRGLGTGLLAARLEHLERESLARKITLPPPARTPAYALTEAGADLGRRCWRWRGGG